MRRTVLVAIAAFILGLPHHAAAQGFTDDFEAGTLDPGWVLVQQQAGTASLSADQNHTAGGNQSLKLASSSGNQRWNIVKRYLGSRHGWVLQARPPR
jgi:hypothetical protein